MTQPTLEHHRAARAIAVSRESIRRAWIAGLSFALVLVAWSFAAQAGTAPNSFADLAERLLPTVVNIATTQTVEIEPGRGIRGVLQEFFERRGGQPPPQEKRRASALGSGFIIDASGYIVTNHHVIADADEITVRLHDDTLLEAELVGSDEKTIWRCSRSSRTSRCRRPPGACPKRPGSATGWLRSATPSASAARSPPASSRRVSATSNPGPTTTSSRPTPRSTAATQAVRCSISTAT